MSESSLLILQYLFDRKGRRVAITDLVSPLAMEIHSLRPAIEDLKTAGYISEDEYLLEIKAEGVHFARSRWV